MRVCRRPPLADAERYFLALLATPRPPLPTTTDDPFWSAVLALAARHRLSEFLHARRAGALQTDWPAPARAVVRGRYVENALRNARFHSELTRVASALRGRGLAPVLLKGGALLQTVYTDPAERPFGDLDLLVRRDELAAATAVMQGLGYRLDESYHAASYYREFHYHLIFRHAVRPWLCFEIHWDLSLPVMDVTFDAAGLRRRAGLAGREGLEILVPSPGDSLLLQALHVGLNRFSILGQIRDVAALAASAPAQLKADDLWRAARAARLVVPLTTSLFLAGHFGGEAPQQLLAARPRPWRSALLRRLLSPEVVLRQRLTRSAAGGRVTSVLRRDDWSGRRAQLGRIVWPGPRDLDMDGQQARGPGGIACWAGGRYGPVALLRSVLWAGAILAGLDFERQNALSAGRSGGSGPGQAPTGNDD